MSAPAAPLASEVAALCRALKLPTVARDAEALAAAGQRQDLGLLDYLHRLLDAELAERASRRAQRRLKEAGFARLKTLESFDFARNPNLPESRIRELTDGRYLDAAETVILLGEPGTGKTHLATALGVAAAEQGRAVRFTTAGQLVNELVEAKDAHALSRVVARHARLELLVLDELGYVPLSRTDAELLFQVLSARHERRALIVTTNLPFAEWTSVFPDARLCRAVIDRLTHRAHIIETGTESVRLHEAMRRHATRRKASSKHG